MKNLIIGIIFLLSLTLTGCYTQLGYDYDREDYWDKVEKKQTPSKIEEYSEDEVYEDSTDQYAEYEEDEDVYESDESYDDDNVNFKVRRYYDYYYPNLYITHYSTFYDPWYWDWWSYPYSYRYSYFPWYSYYYYPYSYWGWYSSGDPYYLYFDNYYSYKTKYRTNWDSRLRENSGRRNYTLDDRSTYRDRATRNTSSTIGISKEATTKDVNNKSISKRDRALRNNVSKDSKKINTSKERTINKEVTRDRTRIYDSRKEEKSVRGITRNKTTRTKEINNDTKKEALRNNSQGIEEAKKNTHDASRSYTRSKSYQTRVKSMSTPEAKKSSNNTRSESKSYTPRRSETRSSNTPSRSYSSPSNFGNSSRSYSSGSSSSSRGSSSGTSSSSRSSSSSGSSGRSRR